jgi:hypothetical protein
MKIKNSFSKGAAGNRKGIALIFLYLVLMVLTILLISFMSRNFTESRASLRNKDAIEASYICEAGIDQVTRDLYDVFNPYFIAQGQKESEFTWFDDLPNSAKYSLPVDVSLGAGTFTVQITNVDTSVSDRRQVTLVSSSNINNITKQMTAVICYELTPSQVFDYAYFVNNFGWFWGNSINNQGDIRANGDFSFGAYHPKVNGDIFAAENPELGSSGNIIGSNSFDTIAQYRSSAGTAARPSNPTADPQDINGDGFLEEFRYDDGFDGASEKFANTDKVEMPYLGDLQQYKDIAIAELGTIEQNGVVLVNHVLDTSGSDSIALMGTATNPIVLNGPVVVTGDVLIKGVVTGQGTIYAGRNVHIVGNITYQAPPSWAKPDTDPAAADTHNDSKDFLALAAKGNVVIGDYTGSAFNSVKSYLKPPFTQPYKVDTTDADNGYVDYYAGGSPYFDGDYTDKDGGKKRKIDGTEVGQRRFYECSFDDTYFNSLCDSGAVTHIDAVCYTNHAFTGNVANAVLNGIIVARDEAIIYSGSLTFNYDIRAKANRLGKKLYLPRNLAMPRTVYLKKD